MAAAGFLAPGRPAIRARAPGRLDVIGGIADYSGSLVLELPLDRAVTATLQAQHEPRLDVVTVRAGRQDTLSLTLEQIGAGALPEGQPWAAYVAGVVRWCLERADAQTLGRADVPTHGGAAARPRGLRILIESTVPEGKGVASSAALEVATMMVTAAHLGIELGNEELAAACQWVENHYVGAPCGIMDQMTSMCGEEGTLLKLLCQPATIEGHVAVPAGFRFYGIDSGIRHAVSGADYGLVRTAAFMGLRIISETAPDAVPGGYLANLAPERFVRLEQVLPDRMSGAEFLHRHHEIADPVTRVARDRLYPVLQATRHPVLENARVHHFAALLAELPGNPACATALGGLMYESHRSYGDCGLGSEGTDRLVEMVREAGEAQGLYGAKITGGGSGGTVAILGTDRAGAAVREIASRYAHETGRSAEVFSASGPGAARTGVIRLTA
ncbi:MAG TPA: hypothetical protein VGI92_07960 [Gemmatimonadales bacterium]|jgi:L-arabinokinase